MVAADDEAQLLEHDVVAEERPRVVEADDVAHGRGVQLGEHLPELPMMVASSSSRSTESSLQVPDH
jgi:hypothetical protein